MLLLRADSRGCYSTPTPSCGHVPGHNPSIEVIWLKRKKIKSNQVLHGGDRGHHHLDVSAEQVGDPWTRAVVRNLLHLDAGGVCQHLGRDMDHGADAGGRVAELARIGVGVGDQLLERFHRQRRMHHQHRGTGGDRADRRENPWPGRSRDWRRGSD